MSRKIVVSLFDHTGNMVAPWAEAGFLCYCVDLQHPAGEHREGNIICVGADVREWLPSYAKIQMLFAFPPCTDVAVSGARWFQDKGLAPSQDRATLRSVTPKGFANAVFQANHETSSTKLVVVGHGQSPKPQRSGSEHK